MSTVEDAAVKYAEGMAEALIGKLGLLLMQEYQLLTGLRGEVVLLRDDAAMMNALLRMFSETDLDAVDHFVREWMKQVRELAYDGEDCMDYFFNRISWAPWRTNRALGFFHRVATLYPRHRLANDIKALRARAIAISECRGRYGVYGQALQPSVAFGSRVPTSSTPAGDDLRQLIGMDDHIQSLSEMLQFPVVDGELLKVCSIVGMGGVGKTTLALAVCRNLTQAFPDQAVVTVSQQFNETKVRSVIETLAGMRYIRYILLVLNTKYSICSIKYVRGLPKFKCVYIYYLVTIYIQI
jgi:disease resistance protein RPM1